MKYVQITEQDRAILKMCTIRTAVGKSSLEDVRALVKAQDTLRTDEIHDRMEECSKDVQEYALEDAQYAAVKRVLESGQEHLPNIVARELVRCHDHLSAAKDAPAAK